MTRDHPLLPYAVTLLGVGLFSLMDALMKGAAIAVGAYSALLLRSFIGTALIGPVWLATRTARPTRAALRVHMTRGVVAAAMAFTFFWGIARIPLAEAIALSFVAPLIALYLAAILLGEQVRPRAVGASLLGLVGVAVILFGRVSSGDWHEGAGWGIASILASSMLYAWNLVLQRQQSQLAGPIEVAAWQNAMVALVLVLFAPLAFEMPGRDSWPTIAGAAVLAVSAALLFAWAYARAEAQALVPLEYSGFLWAMLFGWLFFAEAVRPPVLLGAGLIVAGCWIAAPRKPPEQTAV
ncbi:MAG TPA: DMT family transporter [Croceibacterium sp.]|nr:DMT family transporter [Croceibacterium sp.]